MIARAGMVHRAVVPADVVVAATDSSPALLGVDRRFLICWLEHDDDRLGGLRAAHDGKRLIRRRWLPQDVPLNGGRPDCRAAAVNPARVFIYPARVFKVPGPGIPWCCRLPGLGIALPGWSSGGSHGDVTACSFALPVFSGRCTFPGAAAMCRGQAGRSGWEAGLDVGGNYRPGVSAGSQAG